MPKCICYAYSSIYCCWKESYSVICCILYLIIWLISTMEWMYLYHWSVISGAVPPPPLAFVVCMSVNALFMCNIITWLVPCFSLPFTAVTSTTEGKFLWLCYLILNLVESNSGCVFKDLLPYVIWIHKLHFCHRFGFHLSIADYTDIQNFTFCD